LAWTLLLLLGGGLGQPMNKLAGAVLLSLVVACGAGTVEEQKESTVSELGFVGSGAWTVFKLQAGPNPAEKINGDVRGFVSPEIDRTMLLLTVRGLPPNKTFGAHLHATACNENNGGGHYQHTGTTVNDENEVWLDFTTNASGVAQVVTRKPFSIATERAKSVVVHAQATDPATGKAGDKLACTDVAFVDTPAPNPANEPPGGDDGPPGQGDDHPPGGDDDGDVPPGGDDGHPPGHDGPPDGQDGPPGEDGKSCRVSYSCLNNVCKCGDTKEGQACKSPASCEQVCASCD